MSRRYVLMTTLALAACGGERADVGDGARPEAGEATLQEGLVTCAPRSETGYDRGRAFEIVVVRADGKPVEVATANAYYLMQAAAAEAGIDLRVISGFRSQAEQRYLYDCYVNCSCNHCNLAAYPGYSNHQSGSALDLNTHEPGVYRWLAGHGARFGFYETVPGEDWHWEFFGPAPGEGPCRTDGNPAGPVGPTLEFVTPVGGDRRTNGLWMKARPSEPVAMVRYSADGWFLAASEDAADDYSARYVFNQLGTRSLKAEALDAVGRVVATAEVEVEVVAGDDPQHTLHFSSPRHEGWYRNGVELRAEGSAEIVAVEYFAGPYRLGGSRDRVAGFPLRQVFNTMGYRSLLAVGLDAGGRERARRSIVVRVLPGQEGPVAVKLISPEADSRQTGEVRLDAVASDSVARVVYSADGWRIGARTQADGFELRYRFNQSGRRRVRVEAFDGAGRRVAEDEVEIDVY